MKGPPDIARRLNDLFALHMTAKDMYRLQRHVFKSLGYDKLFDKASTRKDVHDAAGKRIVDRLLFLEFMPTLDHPVPEAVTDPAGFYASALTLENSISAALQDTINAAETSDDVTEGLLEDIQGDVQDNIEWIERQQRIIGDIGLPAYLAEKM